MIMRRREDGGKWKTEWEEDSKTHLDRLMIDSSYPDADPPALRVRFKRFGKTGHRYEHSIKTREGASREDRTRIGDPRDERRW
jgi:hypothetical protein